MRILFVNKFLYPRGGAETYCLELARELASRGHEVQFFGMRDQNNTVGNAAGIYAKPMDFHAPGLKKLSYPLRVLYSRDAKRKALRLAEAFRPDIVHLNNFHFHLTPSILEAFRQKGVPAVMTAHDYQLVCPNHLLYVPSPGKLCTDCVQRPSLNCVRNKCIHGSAPRSALGYLEARLYRLKDSYSAIDRIICPSLFMKRTLDAQPRFADKTVFLRNFCKPCSEGMAEKGDYVIYFGRLSPEKGIPNLLEAAGRLPDIPFIIAGDGPLRAQVENCGYRNVKYAGFRTGGELEALVRGARFSVCPSVCYENCPLSVIESQKLGTPCLATGIGGMKELVSEECRVPEPTAEALARAVRDLYFSKDRLRRLTAELDARAKDYPDVADYADRLLDIYSQAILSHKAR
ncbi:MAG: glycosyltransferase [Clostridia bacterium]|nr:glycosyltransferase [Clostridia bacterium]